MTAGAILRIDLGALVDNYRSIQSWTAPSRVAAVVKADAYGLGAPRVAAALIEAGCDHFFVAHLSEAIPLRRHCGEDIFIGVLNGLVPGAEAECAALGVVPVLNSIDQIDRWARLAREAGRRLPGILQFDTGMSRLGLSAAEVATLIDRPDRLEGIDLRLLMSHLACADTPEAPANLAQAEAFDALCAHFPSVARSLDNSGGALLPRGGHYDLVRAGIALYGGAPRQGPNPMRAVASLDARIIQLRTVEPGSAVGYGLTHRFDRPTRLATLAIGYADGWPRSLSNRGAAYVSGHRAPIVGRVSMDSLTIDVSDVPAEGLVPGGLVEMLGPHQSVDDVARDAGTISYEILTQLGARYARFYVPAPAVAHRQEAGA
ncbi:MAG: alanine racemase [Sphingomonas sp.]|nr:MAG: alanine racemase [Sphingomonas sp.]